MSSDDKLSEAELRGSTIMLPGETLEQDEPKPPKEKRPRRTAPRPFTSFNQPKTAVDTFTIEETYKDVLGKVTNIPGSYYVQLVEIPESISKVFIDYLDCTSACTVVKDEAGNNLPFIVLPSLYYPYTEIEVQYEYQPTAQENAVVKLQQKLGVAPDGKLGPTTLNAAGGAVATVINLTQTDMVLPGNGLPVLRAGEATAAAVDVEDSNIRSLVERGLLRVVATDDPEDTRPDLDFGPEYPSMSMGDLLSFQQALLKVKSRSASVQEMVFRRESQRLCSKYGVDPDNTIIDLETGEFLPMPSKDDQ